MINTGDAIGGVARILGLRRKEVEIGLEAQNLLSSTLLSDSFAKMEGLYLEAALRAPDAKRKASYLTAVEIVRAVNRNLEVLVQTGTLAKRQIESIESGSDHLV